MIKINDTNEAYMSASDAQNCEEFSRYMEEFRQRLRKAIEENKWYMSERIGHDVGEQRATEDFLKNHFDPFAREMRASFCEHRCTKQKNCPLAAFIRSLPSTAQSLDVHTTKAKRKPVDEPVPV
jgi:hypothetical protein